MKYFRWLIYISIILLASSCLQDAPEDFDNPESTWNPDFSFPVGYTSLQMNEESGFDTLLLWINSATGYPFWVDEIDIPMNYTMPFDMQQLDNISDQIIRVMFRLNIHNGFPAIAKGQVYFLDFNQQVVDSMFVDGPLDLESGTLENDGQTVNPSYEQKDIVFNQNKIDDLASVRYIFIKGAIQNLSLDSTLIDNYPNYKLDVQLGVQTELNISF